MPHLLVLWLWFLLGMMMFWSLLLTIIRRFEKKMVWPYGELEAQPHFGAVVFDTENLQYVPGHSRNRGPGFFFVVLALLPKTEFYPGRLGTKQALQPIEPDWILRLFFGGIGLALS